MAGGDVDIGMTSGEIVWAMLILLVVLSVVTFFFCCLPTYKALQARFTYWDDPENDPRWNADQFQFSPTSPQMLAKCDRNKYNRLSTCSTNGDSVSRGSSFRNQYMMPRFPDQLEIKMPPSYSDICDPGSGADLSSLGSPPEYYSHSPSDTEDDNTGKVPAKLAVCNESSRQEIVEKKDESQAPVAAATKLTATEALRKARAEAAKAKRAQKLQEVPQESKGGEKATAQVPKTTPSGVPGLARPNRRGDTLKSGQTTEQQSGQTANNSNNSSDQGQEKVVQPPRKVYKKPRKNPEN